MFGVHLWTDPTGVLQCPPVVEALASYAHAPLAQSAERFHGKEKVVSSILTGGSPDIRVNRRSRRGGVAQSVRALGS